MRDWWRRAVAWILRRRMVRAYLLYAENRGPMLADSITYRALFSVFAGVLLGFSLAALWLSGNPEALRALGAALNTVIPGISDVIDTSRITAPVGFTVVGVFSLVGLVGAAVGAIGSLRAALHVLSGQITDQTMFVWVLLRDLLVAVCFGGLLLVAGVASFFGVIGDGVVLLNASSRDWPALMTTRLLGGVVMFVIDSVAVAVVFRLLAGMRAPARALWVGAMVGGLGLTVLQALSGLFVRGAAANPLLASFAAMIALLLWFNLSAQVILIASSYIITAATEMTDDGREPAATLAQRRVLRAEDRLRAADAELRVARDAQAREDGG